MEAPRLKAAADFAQFWRLRCAVAGDPRLRGEAKTAWEFLFVAKAGRQFTTIETSPEEIAADQGRDNRSGLRVLQALEAAGYIEIIDRPRRSRDAIARSGPWRLFMRDVLEVAVARPGPRSHGQGELFDTDVDAADEATIRPAHGREASPPILRPAAGTMPRPPQTAQPPTADVAQHPPLLLHLENKHSKETSHFKLELKGEGSRKGNGGCGATTAEDPRSMGELLATRDFAGQLLDTVAKTQRLKAWILATADDPDLHPKAAERLAEQVASGNWPLPELAAVLENTRRAWQATLAGTAKDPVRNRTHYLLGAARRSIERHDRSTR